MPKTTYLNLITGEPAEPQPESRAYFELHLFNAPPFGYQLRTCEGEFLSAWGSEPTFKEAWFDALTYTTVGGEAYQAWESRPLPADPGTHPDSPVYDVPLPKLPLTASPHINFEPRINLVDPADDEGFDPYACNLGQLAEDDGWGSEYDYLHYVR